MIDESDLTVSGLLLSVLVEGSFLSLLSFLHQHAPDPITRKIARQVGQDGARHVTLGIAHLTQHAKQDVRQLDRLAGAIEQHHTALLNTTGLNDEVFDALILLAAGSRQPEALRSGWNKVQLLMEEMYQERIKRLRRIGFSESSARSLSALHTKNFM